MIGANQVLRVAENIGLVNKRQVEQASREQLVNPRSFRQVLQDLGYISGRESSYGLLAELGVTPVPMDFSNIKEAVVEKVSPTFAREHRLFPVRMEEDTLVLATDEAMNFLVIDNLKELLNQNKIKLEITTTESINQAINKFCSVEQEDLSGLLAKVDKGYTGETDDEVQVTSTVDAGTDVDDDTLQAPVIKMAHGIIVDALRRRSSDIHLEPLEGRFRIRYRIDGVLQETINPPHNLQGPLIARLKLMAGMDLSEKRLPQDGRIMINAGGRSIDLRVSALPGIYGESLVMRILDKSSMLLNLDDLGFLRDDQKKWEELLRYAGGIALVTGPTGSGKTTTLYTSLSALNTVDRKIMPVEEPVEYQLPGINQTPVRSDIGLTFAAVLRSFLRQAPDVILVGEIRDFETADIALRSALTGHLVFSTLHTNDATSAPTRLIDLGVPPFLAASTVQGVMAQRLVRILCPACKKKDKPTKEEREILKLGPEEDVNLSRPVGCAECTGGFRGRKGIFEIFLVTDAIRNIILRGVSSAELRKAARESGMRTMGEDGLVKVKLGLTTCDEVLSATTLE